MHDIFKLWFMEFLNTLDDHIFESLRFLVDGLGSCGLDDLKKVSNYYWSININNPNIINTTPNIT